MEKAVLITNIDGLLIKHEAFSGPHKEVWKILIDKTGDKGLSKWVGAKDYFIGVNLAMDKLMPKATREEKTLQVRTWYEEAVIQYIKKNPNCIDKQIASKLKELKTKYRLILMTSNTQDHINKILSISNLTNLYDEIIASETNKEPKKSELLEIIFKKYKNINFYLKGKKDAETEDVLRKRNIKVITKEEINLL
jgi:phosphoglycolate phosphatase-like HAD superfamily hydrolase